jgi:hypothetical protein
MPAPRSGDRDENGALGVRRYRFKTAVGRPDALAALAARRGKAWLQGSNAAALAFR